MSIVKAGYEILTPISKYGFVELKKIENIARTCYKSEDKITDFESTKRFIKSLIDSGHESMLEHGSLSVKFTVDRGVTHEIVRHRVASFAQESTRYCNYSKGKFGSSIDVIDISGAVETIPNVSPESINEIMWEWSLAMSDANRHYMKMIEMGATPEIARSVLPTSVKSDIVVTTDYREWRHILGLRALGTTGKPHPQIKEVMLPLLRELQEKIPVVFDFAEVF